MLVFKSKIFYVVLHQFNYILFYTSLYYIGLYARQTLDYLLNITDSFQKISIRNERYSAERFQQQKKCRKRQNSLTLKPKDPSLSLSYCWTMVHSNSEIRKLKGNIYCVTQLVMLSASFSAYVSAILFRRVFTWIAIREFHLLREILVT